MPDISTDNIDNFRFYPCNLRGDSIKVIIDLLDQLPHNLNNIMVKQKIIKEIGLIVNSEKSYCVEN